MFDGTFDWADLQVMVDRLPADSALQTVLRDEIADEEFAAMAADSNAGHGAWNRGHYLLAQLIDAVQFNNALLVAVNSESPFVAPDPVPRPGVVSVSDRRDHEVRTKAEKFKQRQADRLAKRQAEGG